MGRDLVRGKAGFVQQDDLAPCPGQGYSRRCPIPRSCQPVRPSTSLVLDYLSLESLAADSRLELPGEDFVTMTALTDFPDRYFDAWHGDDAGAFDGLLAASFTWVDPSLPEALSHLDGAHDFFTGSKTSFPDLHFESLGAVLIDESGRRVAVTWRMTGTHTAEALPPGVRATGKSIDVSGTEGFTLDADGRATEIRACYDAMTMAGQLGLLG